MGYCGFYEPGGLKYWCNKVNRDVGWAIWDKYCNGDYEECPYLKDDSSCFLTTACIRTKNLPDDCKELQILRHFRDNYVKVQKNGQADIKHYYEVAPKIVAVVSMLSNSNEIYKDIYLNLVSVCVNLIENNKNSEAYKIYKNYVYKLEKEYLK